MSVSQKVREEMLPRLRQRYVAHENSRAKEIIGQALQYSLPDASCAEELRYLKGCLTFGIRFSDIVADVFAAMPDFNDLRIRIRNLKDFVREHYPHDFTSAHEGEMNLWLGYLDRLDAFIDSPAQ